MCAGNLKDGTVNSFQIKAIKNRFKVMHKDSLESNMSNGS